MNTILEITEHERELLMAATGLLYAEIGSREIDELNKKIFELKG